MSFEQWLNEPAQAELKKRIESAPSAGRRGQLEQEARIAHGKIQREQTSTPTPPVATIRGGGTVNTQTGVTTPPKLPDNTPPEIARAATRGGLSPQAQGATMVSEAARRQLGENPEVKNTADYLGHDEASFRALPSNQGMSEGVLQRRWAEYNDKRNRLAPQIQAPKPITVENKVSSNGPSTTTSNLAQLTNKAAETIQSANIPEAKKDDWMDALKNAFTAKNIGNVFGIMEMALAGYLGRSPKDTMYGQRLAEEAEAKKYEDEAKRRIAEQEKQREFASTEAEKQRGWESTQRAQERAAQLSISGANKEQDRARLIVDSLLEQQAQGKALTPEQKKFISDWTGGSIVKVDPSVLGTSLSTNSNPLGL